MVNFKFIDTGIKQIPKEKISQFTTILTGSVSSSLNKLERTPANDCCTFNFIEQKIKALPEKFLPAKTIEEAQNFGKSYLGIKSYTGLDNLEMINYINEGLFEVSKAINGKIVMPHHVRALPSLDKLSPMAATTTQNGERYLDINTVFFDTIDKHLKTQYEKMANNGILLKQNNKYVLKPNFRCGEKAYKLEESINKLLLTNEKRSIKEKMSLSIFNDNLCSFSSNHIKTKAPHVAIRNICYGQGKDSIVLNGRKYTLSDIEKMDITKQSEILKTLLEDKKLPYDFIQNPTSYIAHELEHLQHCNQLGYKKYHELTNTPFLTLRNEELSKKQGINPNAARENMQDFLQDTQKQSIAAEVSDYAKTSPLEFVAEVFARLVEGRTFSKEVMDMYKSYGGTVI